MKAECQRCDLEFRTKRKSPPTDAEMELKMQIEALTRQVNRKDKRIAYLEAEKEETAEVVRGLITKGNELIEELSE
tara:strand:+ start:2384 stop:2611 length:228 start_codon:yes stop_codon:yes gene_type:complete